MKPKCQVLGTSYCIPNGVFWKGLDGSTVLCPRGGFSNGTRHPLPPSTTEPRGFEQLRTTLDPVNLDIIRDRLDFTTLIVGAEERLPNPDTPRFIDEMRKRNPWAEFRFGLLREMPDHFRDLDRLLDQPPADRVSTNLEGNPTSSGVLVTRILLKQLNRRAENRLVSAEKLAVAGYVKTGSYGQNLLLDAWRKFIFTQFHDSVTATHLDPCFDELMDAHTDLARQTETIIQQAAEQLQGRKLRMHQPAGTETLSIFNPHSFACTERVSLPVPAGARTVVVTDTTGHTLPLAEIRDGQAELVLKDLPPLSAVTLRVRGVAKPSKPPRKSHQSQIENEFYHLRCDDHGVVSVWEFWDGFRYEVHRLWGVAVLNVGTPSYRIEDGTILVSVLRSPTLRSHMQGVAFGPDGTDHYTLDVCQGMLDKGEHEFVHALTSFDGHFADSPMPRMSMAMNAPPLVIPGKLARLDLPQLEACGSVIAAVKKAEQGAGLVVRLQEQRGQSEEVSLSLPRGFRHAILVNLLERQPKRLAVRQGQVRVTLRPFQIATVLMTRTGDVER
ncbi:MAG: glycosyl hydrolase-related protein [bacterium]